MKLSIIIPAYNEKNTIEELIRRVKSADIGGHEKEIIVVDDGSRDGTRDILKTIPGITYIFHEKNLGKGGSVKTGFTRASGDIVIIQDADLEYDPRDYKDMIKPLMENRADVTNGIRIQPPSDLRRHKPLYWMSWFGNQAITWSTNILYFHYSGEYEGCYKAFKRHVIEAIPVKTNDFDFDNELICKILRRGYRIVDVPIRYYPRDYDEGKKIRSTHGFKILWTIFKWRFLPF